MVTIGTVAELRATCERARSEGRSVGLVPTMGAFHEGHRSLMRAARAADDLVVVTLFVNPLQFGPGEDLDAYPGDREADAAVAALEGVDVLFSPSVEEMYRPGARTTVHVDGLTEGLCGRSRPGHLDGVTTIVAKLFAAVGSCRAYFGRKDAQQLVVVRRMAADLDLPVEVVGCPIVREPDGLAMSSRNAYLTPSEREVAPILHRSLRHAVTEIERGERDPQRIRDGIAAMVATVPSAALDYVEVRAADDLRPLAELRGDVLVAVAARLGASRLIDNVTVSIGADVRVEPDVTVQELEHRRPSCSAP